MVLHNATPFGDFTKRCLIGTLPGMKIQEVRRARLRRFIDERYEGNVSRFAAAAGKSQSQIADMLDLRKSFGERVARSLEEKLGLPGGWLDQDDESSPPLPTIDDERAGFLPVRRGTLKLSAGVSGWAIEFENRDAPPIFFRRDWVEKCGFRPDKLLALKVQGSSMETGLYDGDTVVVNLADTTPIDGEVFAINFEGECVIKRMKREAGEWWLSSDNADKRRYPDKRVSDGVQLLGRIVFKQSERI